MELLRDQELDSLEALEERIRQAIDLVSRLRREKDSALTEKQQALAERDKAAGETALARDQIAKLSREVETLRAERNEVRTRIEKLLGQIDALGEA